MLQPDTIEQENHSFVLTAFQALGNIGNPVALDFLHQQLQNLTKQKQTWRIKQRDVDIPEQSLTQIQDCATSPTFNSDNLWQKSQWETELGYAIAQIDPEKAGIELLFHDLANVRKGAWLAIGKTGKVEIVKTLIEKRRNSKPYQAHFRHAAYRAIDNSLMIIERLGGEEELRVLHKLFKAVKHAGIKARLEWTILFLEQRINPSSTAD